MTRPAEQHASQPMLRAFFAVALCDEARSAADDVACELRGRADGDGVKWVRPENFHVTLRFLGDIPRSSIPAVAECAANAIAEAPGGHEPFDIQLGELGAFPSLSRPRVVTLDITPHAPLEALANSLDRGVRDAEGAGGAGIAGDERTSPFHSHLTLGRVRRGGRAPSLEAPRPTRPVSTRVDEIVLFQSELDRTGASYTQLERIPLASRN